MISTRDWNVTTMQRLIITTSGCVLAMHLMILPCVAASLDATFDEPYIPPPTPSFQFDLPADEDSQNETGDEDEDTLDNDSSSETHPDAGDPYEQEEKKTQEKVTSKTWAHDAWDLVTDYYPYAGIALMEEMQRAIDRALKGDKE